MRKLEIVLSLKERGGILVVNVTEKGKVTLRSASVAGVKGTAEKQKTMWTERGA